MKEVCTNIHTDGGIQMINNELDEIAKGYEEMAKLNLEIADEFSDQYIDTIKLNEDDSTNNENELFAAYRKAGLC